jgi:hypothetical protein
LPIGEIIFRQPTPVILYLLPKSEKPIKAMIRHLPLNTPAEDISDGLVNLGFEVVSIKQMTTTCQSSPEESKITKLHKPYTTLSYCQ